MTSTYSTRVKAPDSPAAGTPSAQVADMMVFGQSSFGDAHRRMKTGRPATTFLSSLLDLRSTVNVVTWNVLTLSSIGYQVAWSREMALLDLEIVGLTEARITDSGRYEVEGSLFLHSGATTLVQGYARMPCNKAKKALRSWSPISPILLIACLTHRHGYLSVVVACAAVRAC